MRPGKRLFVGARISVATANALAGCAETLARRTEPGEGEISTRKLSWPGTREQIRTISAWWALAMIDAAIVSEDPADLARAKWILDGKGGR